MPSIRICCILYPQRLNLCLPYKAHGGSGSCASRGKEAKEKKAPSADTSRVNTGRQFQMSAAVKEATLAPSMQVGAETQKRPIFH